MNAVEDNTDDLALYAENPLLIRSVFVCHMKTESDNNEDNVRNYPGLNVPWDALVDVILYAVLLRKTLRIDKSHRTEADVISLVHENLTDVVLCKQRFWPHTIIGPQLLQMISDNCARLVRLDLPHVTIDDAQFSVIPPRCVLLEHLDITGSCALTDASLHAVARYCPQLQFLSVRETDGNITDDGIVAVANACRRLTSLDVSSTAGQITDDSICDVSRCCSKLRSLSVADTGMRITDASISQIGLRCPELRELDVSATNGTITDVSIFAIAAGCPLLECLNVAFTAGKITDQGIIQMARKCRCLQSLDVGATKGFITDASIREVKRSCLLLSYLDVTDAMGKVTSSMLQSLAIKCTVIR